MITARSRSSASGSADAAAAGTGAAAALQPAARVVVLHRKLVLAGAERQLLEFVGNLAPERVRNLTLVPFYGGPLEARAAAIEGLRIDCLDKRGRWDLLPFLVRTGGPSAGCG